MLSQREGIVINHKRLYRLYREEHLAIRRKKRKRVAQVTREPKPLPATRNERWSMDFVHDTLFDGGVFRALTILDDFSRECPAIEGRHSRGRGSSEFWTTWLARTVGLR